MRVILCALLLSFASILQAAPLPQLRGDAEATARIEKMLGRMGGRERWAETKSLYIRYHQFDSGRRGGEGEERAWRDVSLARERLEQWRIDIDGQSWNWARSFDAQGGWIRQAVGLRRLTQEEHGRRLRFWGRDFYTMFRRMAAGDTALIYRFTAPNRIDVSEGGKDIGWWDIDRGGALLRWGTLTSDGLGELSYIYGPYKRYGAIAVPAWGASSDGLFRFEYLEFQASPRPLPDSVFLDPSKQPPAELRLR